MDGGEGGEGWGGGGGGRDLMYQSTDKLNSMEVPDERPEN